MASRRTIAAWSLAVLCATGVVYAQGNPYGKLTGTVTAGEAATPLAGVVVTVTSPQLQGQRTATTTAAGEYLFAALPPGDYQVSFDAQGMASVKKQVRLAAAQTSTLDAVMDLPSVSEEIVVTGAQSDIASVVSEGAQSQVTYSKPLVDALPAGRTINQIVALAPGVQPNGPTKDSGTGLSNITISGAASYENLFMLNGVVLNENIRGQAFDLFIEDAIQETTTAASGISAEYGRFSGGVVNVITKSGGNDFSGSFRVTFNNQKWENRTQLTNSQTDKVIPTYEATFGGPLLRDRLWFFGAGRSRKQDSSQTTAAPTLIAFQNVRDQQRYEGKLTATLTPRHTLFGTYSKIDDTEDGNFFGTILDTASLVNRSTPQELWSVNYTGSLTDNLLLSGQYSERTFSFVNSGATSTDLISGTLLLDRSRGSARYHSPTFCGICRPEDRNNKNGVLKASYFLSTPSFGSHDLVAGYDNFDDIRAADNHQSGSDWRILGTSATITGDDISPTFLGDGSTIFQFNPIFLETRGTDFVTESVYANDTWRFSDHWTFNLGLRYDKNDGKNAAGQKVARDSNVSPRLAAAFDPQGSGKWIFHAGYGKYVAALANSIGDSSSAGGVPAAFQWLYHGPDLIGLSQDDAIRAAFDWFTAANGGLPTTDNPLGGGLQPVVAASIPGVNAVIRGSLSSPNVQEYSLGVSARIGARGVVRADLVRRDWRDFYHQRTDLSTGQVQGQVGTVVQRFDLTVIENNNSLYERTYDGLHTAFNFQPLPKLSLGGTWTFSKSEGNYNGETQGSGPVPGGLGNYPEYFDASWSSPKGPLSIDQRHRISLYGVYQLVSTPRHTLGVSLLQFYGSGHPYEAVGTVRTGPFVTNPGYLNPPVREAYFFSKRGAFTTPSITHTDVALNYDLRLARADLFLKGEMVNVFDEEKVDTTDVRYFNTSVLTADNNALCPGSPTGRCLPFNPFTEKPVEGVNYVKGPSFGKPINALGFQQPRTYRFYVGFRF